MDIYIDDLIKEIEAAQKEINQRVFDESSVAELKNMLYKLEILKFFGAKDAESEEKLKQIMDNDEQWKSLQKIIGLLLTRAKRLKKEGKKVVTGIMH